MKRVPVWLSITLTNKAGMRERRRLILALTG